MRYTSLNWILVIFLLAACDSGSQRRINRDEIREEIRNREPKKIAEAQIIEEAFRQGKLIAEESQKELFNTLVEAVEQGSPAQAIQFCNIRAISITDSLSKRFNATIKRTSIKNRNPLNEPGELEKQLLEAYEYNFGNGLPLEENVQRIEYEYLLYSKPIVMNNSLCLKCHGEPQKDISSETELIINRLYPSDSARHYKMDDFRGIWSIKLRQKDLVNAL